MKLKIEYVPIDSIKPYKRNAKLHPDEQVEQICNSIKETGFNDPIGIWHEQVVEGHGRLLAAKKLGMKEVPIIRLDELTDEQRRAYALAHNKLTMNSGFDIELLDMELAEIESLLKICRSEKAGYKRTEANGYGEVDAPSSRAMAYCSGVELRTLLHEEHEQR